MANWGDLERRAAALRKEIAGLRQTMTKLTRAHPRGDLSEVEQLRQLEELRTNELLSLEKELASRPY